MSFHELLYKSSRLLIQPLYLPRNYVTTLEVHLVSGRTTGTTKHAKSNTFGNVDDREDGLLRVASKNKALVSILRFLRFTLTCSLTLLAV